MHYRLVRTFDGDFPEQERVHRLDSRRKYTGIDSYAKRRPRGRVVWRSSKKNEVLNSDSKTVNLVAVDVIHTEPVWLVG